MNKMFKINSNFNKVLDLFIYQTGSFCKIYFSIIIKFLFYNYNVNIIHFIFFSLYDFILEVQAFFEQMHVKSFVFQEQNLQ